MSAVRRHSSHLLSVLLLCVAIFGNHTAHAAKTAAQPFRQTPCRVKVAAVAPAGEIGSNVRARRTARLPQGAELHLAVFADSRRAEAEASTANLQKLRVREGIVVPAQTRPFVLRI